MDLQSNSHAALEHAFHAAWGVDTTSDPEGWTIRNPAWGQCAVTALVVQDDLGGQLLRASTPSGSHYWNLLPDGTEVDLTREQFGGNFEPGNIEVRDRGYVLSFGATRHRYELLRRRISLAAIAA